MVDKSTRQTATTKNDVDGWMEFLILYVEKAQKSNRAAEILYGNISTAKGKFSRGVLSDKCCVCTIFHLFRENGFSCMLCIIYTRHYIYDDDDASTAAAAA